MNTEVAFIEVEQQCKFCKRPILLKIDPEFMYLGDSIPFGYATLVKLACCNRCSDLRSRRRSIVEPIKELCCTLLSERNPAVLTQLKDDLREPLRTLLMKYRGLAEDWHCGDCGEWDETVVDAILNAPKFYGNVLTKIWNQSRQRTMV